MGLVTAAVIFLFAFFMQLYVWYQNSIFDLARKGRPEEIRYLANSGTNFLITNSDGDTPLYFVIRYNTPEAVKAIMEARIYVNAACDKDGNTALIVASKFRGLEIAKILVRAGADKNIRNYWGKTAYDYALERNADSFLLELLRPTK